jgi:hypothetical protein
MLSDFDLLLLLAVAARIPDEHKQRDIERERGKERRKKKKKRRQQSF